MPYLIQKKADGTLVQQWQLGEKAIVFGRSGDAEVQIDDPEMSKRHFVIERRGASYFVRDLKSSNGTWLHKRRVEEAELKPGEQIRAGQSHFAFEKGVGTIIGELAEEQKSYETVLKEITKATDPRGRRT